MGNTTSDAVDQLLNESENVLGCTDRLGEEVRWSNLSVLTSFVVLGLINIMVIAGNTLVIMAVFLSSKLRTVTNLFIVSLAMSDLMVGIAVLPFSTTYEVFGIWIFGNIWCKMWLAVDVWMCTASILNLCAISLDRYVAVTRPVSYPSIMSSKRAKILIALVWVVSFVICLPPLVGWSDAHKDSNVFKPTTILSANNNAPNIISASSFESPSKRSLLFYDNEMDSPNIDYEDYDSVVLNFSENINIKNLHDKEFYFSNNIESNFSNIINDESSSINISTDMLNTSSTCTCSLTSDKGYRIYSALGSFYLPMLVMMFFYWRIYKAAVETTRAINQGFRTTKSSSSVGGRFDEQRLTLRIHRGRSSTDLYSKVNGTCESSSVSFRGGSRRIRNSSFKETSVGVDQVTIAGTTFPPSNDHKICAVHISRPKSTTSNVSGKAYSSINSSRRKILRHHWTSISCRSSRNSSKMSTYTTTSVSTELSASDNGSLQLPVKSSDQDKDNEEQNGDDRKGAQLFSKMGKRNIKAQVKRFRTETKAAKTLGIIVGGFILCWLPFFTVYLIGAERESG